MVKLDECNDSPMLMEYGVLPTAQAGSTGGELYRGMPVMDQNGLVVGHVAAVVVAHNDHVATHILLHEDHQPQYRHCSIDLIRAVVDGKIQLQIAKQMLKNLPLWHSEY